MTDWLAPLVATQGLWLLALVTYLSCLALPVPASLMMLTGGAFVASGDLIGWQAASAAFAGAVLGDQTGYRLGLAGGRRLSGYLATRPKRAALMAQARALTDRWGGPGVFLSRWLVSPLGPYVNFAGGVTGLGWMRFTAWGAAGEAVWVMLYIGLGYAFASNITAVAEFAGDASGMIAAAVVTLGLGLWLRRALKSRHRTQAP